MPGPYRVQTGISFSISDNTKKKNRQNSGEFARPKISPRILAATLHVSSKKFSYQVDHQNFPG